MSKTSPRIFVTGFNKKYIQRNTIIINGADYDYILDEIECREHFWFGINSSGNSDEEYY